MLEIELGVEHHAYVGAYPLTIVDGNRFGRGIASAGRARQPVDDDSQQPTRRLAPELDIEDVEPEVAGDPLRDRPDLRHPAFTGLHPVLLRPAPKTAP